MVILSFGAHPADPISDFGGALAKNVKHGDTVFTIALTYGIEMHTEMIAHLGVEKIKKVREEEMVEASKFMGFAPPRIMGWDPVSLSSRQEWDLGIIEEVKIIKLADIIREIKPEIVVTHNPEDSLHHSATSKAVTRACELAQYEHIKTSYPPHRIKSLYWNFESCALVANKAKPSIETFSETYLFDYDVVDVTETIDMKAKATAIFKSRGYTYEDLANGYRGEARRFSAFVEPEYVEVYKRVHGPHLSYLE